MHPVTIQVSSVIVKMKSEDGIACTSFWSNGNRATSWPTAATDGAICTSLSLQ
jgi:hypothetical protein